MRETNSLLPKEATLFSEVANVELIEEDLRLESTRDHESDNEDEISFDLAPLKILVSEDETSELSIPSLKALAKRPNESDTVDEIELNLT